MDYGNLVILLLHVDDMIVAGTNKNNIATLNACLCREFEIKGLEAINKMSRCKHLVGPVIQIPKI